MKILINSFYALLTIAFLGACSQSELDSESIQSVDQGVLVCNEIDDLLLNNLSIDEYGKIHNSILSTMKINNTNFDLDNSSETYLAYSSIITKAISINFERYQNYISIESIPDYENALQYTCLGFIEDIPHANDHGLKMAIDKSTVLLTDIPNHILNNDCKSIILNMLMELKSNNAINFQAYIDEINGLDDLNSVFIGSTIVSITSNSTCFWEDHYGEGVQTRILPFLAGLVAVDCLGAIGGVWWKGATDIWCGNGNPNLNSYGNAALGGAVTSSGMRLGGA